VSGELKPCPFCGSAPSGPTEIGGNDERNGYNFTVQISCGSCGAIMASESHSNDLGWCTDNGQAEADARINWNRRSTQPSDIAEAPTDTKGFKRELLAFIRAQACGGSAFNSAAEHIAEQVERWLATQPADATGART
jgi:Lar family restriction alleviation protein